MLVVGLKIYSFMNRICPGLGKGVIKNSPKGREIICCYGLCGTKFLMGCHYIEFLLTLQYLWAWLWESISEIADETVVLRLHSWLWMLISPCELANSPRKCPLGRGQLGSTRRHSLISAKAPLIRSITVGELVWFHWFWRKEWMQQIVLSRWRPEEQSVKSGVGDYSPLFRTWDERWAL